VDAVLLPGDIELATERERSRDGIPLPESTWAALAGLAGELRVPMPEPAMRAG
jgi:uncharacterized oxidoreductase